MWEVEMSVKKSATKFQTTNTTLRQRLFSFPSELYSRLNTITKIEYFETWQHL